MISALFYTPSHHGPVALPSLSISLQPRPLLRYILRSVPLLSFSKSWHYQYKERRARGEMKEPSSTRKHTHTHIYTHAHTPIDFPGGPRLKIYNKQATILLGLHCVCECLWERESERAGEGKRDRERVWGRKSSMLYCCCQTRFILMT